MYICICNAISETKVIEAVRNGVTTFEQLQEKLGVGTCCGCCTQTAHEYLPKAEVGCGVGCVGACCKASA